MNITMILCHLKPFITDNELICAMRDYVPKLAQIQDEKQLEETERFARKYADSIGFHHETKRHWKWWDIY